MNLACKARPTEKLFRKRKANNYGVTVHQPTRKPAVLTYRITFRVKGAALILHGFSKTSAYKVRDGHH